jgi:hypothetical protein
MKVELKQLFRDLNVAVMLQRPEAVDVALDGLLMLPGVSANDRMSEGFITQVILPVGEMLSGLPPSWLSPLRNHPLAAGRAIGAAATAHYFIANSGVSPEDLRHLAADPRPDVRLSLGRTLAVLSEASPDKVFDLGKKWLSNPSPKLRQTALIFLPSLAAAYALPLFQQLHTLEAEQDRAVRDALVEALTALGKKGFFTEVLHLLMDWSETGHPDEWVICRTLSASWAAAYPGEVKSILQQLLTHFGESKTITNALKALKRNGLDIDLDQLAAE